MWRSKNILMAILAVSLLAACSSHKTLNNGNQTGIKTPASERSVAQKAYDHALYQSNVVSKINFSLRTKGKNISVPGSIHMRANDVIRLQLFVPILGTEVGRLEFTKDYVLIVDRIHKQYIQADYRQVSFLKDKEINFYTLQALFWNKLFAPGHDQLRESDLKAFTVDESGQQDRLTLKKGGMDYEWCLDKENSYVRNAKVSYQSATHGTSTLNWAYDDFRTFGSKSYPHHHVLTIQTTAPKQQRDMTVTLDMNGVSNDTNWETRTTVSAKYKQVSVDEVLKQLINF